MIQQSYKRRIMERFMPAKELITFDQKYQREKVPTANNLGEQTLQQLIRKIVKEEVK